MRIPDLIVLSSLSLLYLLIKQGFFWSNEKKINAEYTVWVYIVADVWLSKWKGKAQLYWLQIKAFAFSWLAQVNQNMLRLKERDS